MSGRCSGMETAVGCVRVLNVDVRDSDLGAACRTSPRPLRKRILPSRDKRTNKSQTRPPFIQHRFLITSIHVH